MAQRKKGPARELLSKQHKPAVSRFRQRRHEAKNDWVSRLMDELEVGLNGGERKQNPRGIVKRTQPSMTKLEPRSKPMMTQPSGPKATTEEGNVEVFVNHLKKLLQRVPNVTEEVLQDLPQQSHHDGVGRLPIMLPMK
jgi:hypothetical protein